MLRTEERVDGLLAGIVGQGTRRRSGWVWGVKSCTPPTPSDMYLYGLWHMQGQDGDEHHPRSKYGNSWWCTQWAFLFG